MVLTVPSVTAIPPLTADTTLSFVDGEAVPIPTLPLGTYKSVPTVTLPLASLTMLFVVPEGWITLIVLRVEMAASYLARS